MKYVGKMLVYFGRHLDAPRVWCVAHPDRAWELQVESVTFVGVSAQTKYNPAIKPQPNHDGPPSAYFEVFGTLNVSVDGRASITLPQGACGMVFHEADCTCDGDGGPR